jgi:hypothetical protein
MSKNTDLSSLINYVKGASTGQLIAPSYTSASSFTGTIAGYLGFDSSGNILTASGGSQWITSGSNIYYNAGRVGIGAASPTSKLHVVDTSFPYIHVSNSSGTEVKNIFGVNGVSQGGYLGTVTNHFLGFITNDTERLRITTNGNLTLGTTNPHQGDLVPHRSLTIFGGSNSSIGLTNGTSGQKGTFSYDGETINIINNSTTGSIAVTARTQGVVLFANGSSWTSMSDESTKTDLIPIVDGLNKVVSLRALTGRYKTDEEGKSRAFLIAQDVQSVLPEAVTKNLENDKLMLSYTDVIPLLVASIKELKNELDILKTKNQ